MEALSHRAWLEGDVRPGGCLFLSLLVDVPARHVGRTDHSSAASQDQSSRAGHGIIAIVPSRDSFWKQARCRDSNEHQHQIQRRLG